jgi:glycine/D-amino acid oxidase-like deaminating enzyme/nitrite reductase/ring-hydroxylating ferredoxin subunit
MDEQSRSVNQLPSQTRSYWIDSVEIPEFPSLNEDMDAEVVIAGAGIAGLTTAYLLAREGVDVVVLEADRVLHGTTGHTTAKVTAQHNLIYDELIHYFGVEGAKRYYEANRDAMAFIRHTVEQHAIPCGLRNEDAYVYAASETDLKKLEKELEAYAKLGIEGDWVNSLPLPTEAGAIAAVAMRNQSQFHPLRYLMHLLREAIAAGVRIYEHSPAYSIDTTDKDRPVLKTKAGHSVRSRKLVAATHYPFCDGIGLFYARLYAVKSYVVAIEPEQPYPGGMYISASTPTRSLRSCEENGRTLVLVSGENHRTGTKEDTRNRFDTLAAFGHKLFGAKSIPYRWSAQDIIPPDKVPYVGSMSKDQPNIYVATAFHKWGMTNGTAAGHILTDLIQGRENPYAELFAPVRFKANPDAWKLLKENAVIAKEWITGKLDLADRKIDELGPDEGAVVRLGAQRAGAYRDPHGQLHLVDTTCTHMGCELEWNGGERTWDCPCHGSRFDYDGGVVEGPAVEPLTRLAEREEALSAPDRGE